jgi:hypothetical protein
VVYETDDSSFNNKPDSREGVSQRLAQLVMAARVAQQVRQAATAQQQLAAPQQPSDKADAIQNVRSGTQGQARVPKQDNEGAEQSSRSSRGDKNEAPASCPAVPQHPGYASVDENIAESERRRAPFGVTLYFPWWYNQVKNKGPWDYKQQGKYYDDLGRLSKRSPFEDFGNFNYGATAAAHGIPEWLALRGAGWASLKADPSREKMGLGLPWSLRHPFGLPPYGDDPNDQAQIKSGYEYYQNHCKELPSERGGGGSGD